MEFKGGTEWYLIFVGYRIKKTVGSLQMLMNLICYCAGKQGVMLSEFSDDKVSGYHLAWSWSSHHQPTNLLLGQMLTYKLGADRSPRQRSLWRPEYNSLLWEAKGWGGEWIVGLWTGCLPLSEEGAFPNQSSTAKSEWLWRSLPALSDSHIAPLLFFKLFIYISVYASILQMGFVSRLTFWTMLTWE